MATSKDRIIQELAEVQEAISRITAAGQMVSLAGGGGQIMGANYEALCRRERVLRARLLRCAAPQYGRIRPNYSNSSATDWTE